MIMGVICDDRINMSIYVIISGMHDCYMFSCSIIAVKRYEWDILVINCTYITLYTSTEVYCTVPK